MNPWFRAAAILLLVLAVVVAAVLAAAWAVLPLDGVTVTIDGETFSPADLSGAQLAAAFAIALVVSLAALIVGALAVAFALVVAALSVGVGVLATAASLALVALPFVLVGWLVWRLFRRPRAGAATTTAAPA